MLIQKPSKGFSLKHAPALVFYGCVLRLKNTVLFVVFLCLINFKFWYFWMKNRSPPNNFLSPGGFYWRKYGSRHTPIFLHFPQSSTLGINFDIIYFLAYLPSFLPCVATSPAAADGPMGMIFGTSPCTLHAIRLEYPPHGQLASISIVCYTTPT